MKDIKVYIASPYTLGWIPAMVRLQLETCDQLMEMGYLPYTPLLTHFQEIYSSRPESEWLRLDFAFLKCCNAMLRLKPLDKDGKEIPSLGADAEEQCAIENNIPVFYTINELNDHFKSNASQEELF